MRARHRHQWSEVGRTVNRPAYGATIERSSQDFLERMAFGFTVVELRCECGDVAFRSVVGRSDRP